MRTRVLLLLCAALRYEMTMTIKIGFPLGQWFVVVVESIIISQSINYLAVNEKKMKKKKSIAILNRFSFVYANSGN